LDRRTEYGYSLIELMLVTACTVILFLAAVPALDRIQNEWMLWSAAHLLENSLQWGRMYAISTNTSVVMEVDPGGSSFFWSDPVSAARLESTTRQLPRNVRIVACPNHPVRFYPRGNAAPAGTYSLQGNVGTYRVIVNIAGRIRVEKN
jgi:Tfp pilus assembly protein FimT